MATSTNNRRKQSIRQRLSILSCLAIAGLLVHFQDCRIQAAQGAPFQLGLVTLTQVTAGQETSASIVIDSKTYSGVPALEVTPLQVSGLQGEVAAGPSPVNNGMLSGLVVDMGDGRKQPADGPITWIPQPGARTVTLYQRNGSGSPVATATIPNPSPGTLTSPISDESAAFANEPISTRIEPPATNSVAPISNTASVATSSYTMPPVVANGGVQVIHGDTVGNSNNMKVTVNDVPARIVAAKEGTVIWKVPETLEPGSYDVAFSPGPGKPAVKLPLYVLGLTITADQPELIRGQRTRMRVTVTLKRLPASLWQSDLPPAELVDLSHWKQQTGLQPPKASGPGTVYVVVENESTHTIRMGSHGARLVLQLHEKDLANGTYVCVIELQSLQPGPYSIHANATAFLKQVAS